MDMGFFIGTADRREPEFEHGAHSSLVREVLPPEFLRSFEGGSPDGGRNTGTKRDRPAFRLPRLSHHNLDAYRQKTQKNTLARVVRFVYTGSHARLQILLQRANFTAKAQRTSINYMEILPCDQSRRQGFL